MHRILRYLKGTPGKGLWFAKSGHLEVDGYSDSDWASCQDDRRSTSNYCVFVGGNLVSWRSKKQTELCLDQQQKLTKDHYLKGCVICSG